ncbi:MAG TPA: twin-arginine translocase TatA/TatE family subunit [Gemmatimonadaceae bacterium]|nr:twin-arginine translocase TatA/TatE family subunit [Gemmatimonadaceae bacterium]
MFGNLGFGEIMLILLVVLLLFGAKRIPEIAGSFGKGIKEFKKNMNDIGNTEVPPTQERERLRSPENTAASTKEESRPEPKRLI